MLSNCKPLLNLQGSGRPLEAKVMGQPKLANFAQVTQSSENLMDVAGYSKYMQPVVDLGAAV